MAKSRQNRDGKSCPLYPLKQTIEAECPVRRMCCVHQLNSQLKADHLDHAAERPLLRAKQTSDCIWEPKHARERFSELVGSSNWVMVLPMRYPRPNEHY